MSAPAHTPGPWHYYGGTRREESLDWHIIRAGERQTLIAKVLEIDSDGNAALIAAAPELYEAVAGLLELIADIEQDGFRMTAEQVAFARDCEASLAKASPSTPSTKA